MISVILRRYFELLLSCIGFSLIFTYCHINSFVGEINSSVRIFIVFLIGLFMIYNGYVMRNLYLRTYDSFEYYFTNIVSFLLFLGTVALLWSVLSTTWYKWFFSFVNIFYYMFSETGYVWSSVLFYVMIGVCIFISKIYYDRKVSR